MTAIILRGDARCLPLPDGSVDLVVTSPPYFSLRSYTDGGEHYGGQIGSEPTPAEYIAALIDCTREWVRVLKPSGSIWVNLGDKYAGGGGQWDKDERDNPIRTKRTTARTIANRGALHGYRPKSLMLLPERYRIAAVDELGLIARAVVIWSKPNGLPESVTDRVRRSHEDWVHLTKQPRYYSAVDEIREAHVNPNAYVGQRFNGANKGAQSGGYTVERQTCSPNPLGKLPGSVWEVATEPLTVPDHLGVDHFAAFPTEWPRRIILGWSPSGICVECGEGRRPVSERESPSDFGPRDIGRLGQRKGVGPLGNGLNVRPTHMLGYSCDCSPLDVRVGGHRPPSGNGSEGASARRNLPPTRPSVILDPFGGTGTTALVAKALGRTGISVDMSADYCRLAAWRTNDPGQIAKAMRVDKPPPVMDGQLSLLDLVPAIPPEGQP